MQRDEAETAIQPDSAGGWYVHAQWSQWWKRRFHGRQNRWNNKLTKIENRSVRNDQ